MKPDEDRAYDRLDMALVDDEALVLLAKECEYGPARDEILLRYTSQTERMIQWMSRSTQVGASDIDDARQNAVFWMVEAINKFDLDQADFERRCSFHSFLYRVISARLKDFSKHIRRVEQRRQLVGGNAEDADLAARLFRDLNDPAVLAEVDEAVRQLRNAVESLDEESQQIWRLLCNGTPLKDIASELGISYDAVKRRRRKLISSMKLHLRKPSSSDSDEGSPQSPLSDDQPPS